MTLNTFAIATTRVNNAMAAVKAAESVNALLHLDERDQASLVEVIQDHFTSPNCDNASDSDGDDFYDSGKCIFCVNVNPKIENQ